MTKFQIVLASVVTGVWVLSLIARIFHETDQSTFNILDSIVLLVFGFIFSAAAVRKKANGNGTTITEDLK